MPGPGGRDKRVLRRTGSTFVRGCGRSHVTVRRGTAIGLLHASSRSLRARGQRRGQCDRETRGQTPTFFGGPARKALCYGFCFHTASPLFSTPTIHECGENREVKSAGWVSVCRADKRCAGGVGPGGFEPPLTDPKSAVLPLDEGPVRRKLSRPLAYGNSAANQRCPARQRNISALDRQALASA